MTGLLALLRKNWFVLSTICLTLVGFILSVVLIATGGILPISEQSSFMGSAMEIGYMLFFLGITIFLIVGLVGLPKRVRACIILATGILTAVFMLLALVYVIDNWENAYRHYYHMQGSHAQISSSWARFLIFPAVIQFIVFGLFPVLFGLQRLLASMNKVGVASPVVMEEAKVVEKTKKSSVKKTKITKDDASLEDVNEVEEIVGNKEASEESVGQEETKEVKE